MLSFIIYELSKNLKIQEKLRGEIEEYFVKNEKVSYEAVATPTLLPYLDRVVQEALRLHTIGSHIDRVCTVEFFKKKYFVTVKSSKQSFVTDICIE